MPLPLRFPWPALAPLLFALGGCPSQWPCSSDRECPEGMICRDGVCATIDKGDSTYPDLNVEEPLSGDRLCGHGEAVRVWARDGESGIVAVEVGDRLAEWSGEEGLYIAELSDLASGPLAITVRAQNSVGLTASQTIAVTVDQAVCPDVTPPELIIDYPRSYMRLCGAVVVRGRAWDDESDLAQVMVQGLAADEISSSGAFQSLVSHPGQGVQEIVVEASNTAGLASQRAVRVVLDPGCVDDDPPLVHVSFPAEGEAILSSSITVMGSVSDGASGISLVRVTLNDRQVEGEVSGALDTFQATFDDVTDGPATLSARALDGAGNASVHTIHFIVDAQPGQVTFLDPQPGLVPPTFPCLLQASNPGTAFASVMVMANETQAQAQDLGEEMFQAWLTLPHGPATLEAQATDTVGRVASAEPLNVVVDATPPHMEWVSPAPAQLVQSLFDVVIGAVDGESLVASVVLEGSFDGSPLELTLLEEGLWGATVPSPELADQPGRVSLALRAKATNGVGLKAWVDGEVELNRAPAIVVEEPIRFTEGGTVEIVLRAQDPDGDALEAFSCSPLPAGASHDAKAGVFTWTPAPYQVGTFQLDCQARDNRSASTERTVTLIVEDLPDRLVTLMGGGGELGQGDPDTAHLATPSGLVSTPQGLLVADPGAERIMLLDRDRSLTTVVGGGGLLPEGSLEATDVGLSLTLADMVEVEAIWFQDRHRLVRYWPAQGMVETVSPVAGLGERPSWGLPVEQADMIGLCGLALEQSGKLALAFDDRIYLLDRLERLARFAGGGSDTLLEGPLPLSRAKLRRPCRMAMGNHDCLFVAETMEGGRILCVHKDEDLALAVAGGGQEDEVGSIDLFAVDLGLVIDLAYDPATQCLLVASTNGIWRLHFDRIDLPSARVEGWAQKLPSIGTDPSALEIWEGQRVVADRAGFVFDMMDGQPLVGLPLAPEDALRQALMAPPGALVPDYRGGRMVGAYLVDPLGQRVRYGNLGDRDESRMGHSIAPGALVTVAGGGTGPLDFHDPLPATSALLSHVASAVTDGLGGLFLGGQTLLHLDSAGLIRRLTPDPGPYDPVGLLGQDAYLGPLADMDQDDYGGLYLLADKALWHLPPSTGAVSLVAGMGRESGLQEVPLDELAIKAPTAMAILGDGLIVLAVEDGLGVARVILLNLLLETMTLLGVTVQAGMALTVAGGGEELGWGGPARQARLYRVEALARDPEGGLLLADKDPADPTRGRLLHIDDDGQLHVLAGSPTSTLAPYDNAPPAEVSLGPLTALLAADDGTVALAESGRVWIIHRDIEDTGELLVRYGVQVRPYRMALLAGGGQDQGEMVLGRDALLRDPRGLALVEPYLAIAEAGGHRVLFLDQEGHLLSAVGRGEEGHDGDGGLALEARLSSPSRLRQAMADMLLIMDPGNNDVRAVNFGSTAAAVAGVVLEPRIIASVAGEAGPGGEGGPAYTLPALPGEERRSLLTSSEGDLLFVEGTRIRALRRGEQPFCGPDSLVETLAGQEAGGSSPDGTLARGALLTLADPALAGSILALGPEGRLMFLDGAAVRQIDGEGYLNTVVDGLGRPLAMAVDRIGQIFLLMEGPSLGLPGAVVGRLDERGALSLLAGGGEAFLQEDIPPLETLLAPPGRDPSLAITPQGLILLGEGGDGRVRGIYPW